MSLLSVVRRANILVGLRRPTVAAAAPDATSSAQMAEMARVEAESLAERHDWQGIVFAHQYTSVGAQAQPGGLPDDFKRFTYPGGIYGPWGRIDGPIDKADWSRITSFPNMDGALNGSFRVFSNALQMYPAPPAGQIYRFNYVTKNLYADEDGNPKLEWEDDTDTCAIPEDLIALGVVWRWLQAKGLDYAEALRNAETLVQQRTGNDGGGRRPILVGKPRLKAESYAFPGVIIPPQ